MTRLLHFFSLFGSLSTLLCCALPVTLVTFGMGASFASLTSAFPQITWLTLHKDALFIGTGLALMISFILLQYASTQTCPTEPGKKEACQRSRTPSKWIFWLSICIYVVGLSFSYIIPRFIYGISS